ncbi:OLC1v1035901C2 [Oldenlandia corymbosa var. corymbosa]|nr:OLC1v1035901C2 [Oldenlandia corymbosa var. corymbosa]
MEVFSNAQLIIMTFLMFLGGEVLTSLLALQFMKLKRTKDPKIANTQSDDNLDQIELGVINLSVVLENDQKSLEGHHHHHHQNQDQDLITINSKNIAFENILASIVVCYLLLVHFLGSTLIYTYFEIISNAKKVLREKGLNLATFSIFTTVSTFANCGFIPTNENMMIFKKNSGLLLIIIPQVLLGNTLYPACLRCFMWLLHKTTKRPELKYILKNPKVLGYDHLFTSLHSKSLAVTVAGFVAVQFSVFGVLEWNSEATSGMSGYQKVVGSLFQVVNSRHSGESVFDLSLISPAMIVIFVIMMYLPPYTCFLPTEDAKTSSTEADEAETATDRKRNIISYLFFSQLTYLAIFIILVCIAEREKLKEDPLNFSLLNIVVEVISAYRNVGFSMGYSCKRQIKANESCKDASYGFAGKWSNKGKLILIVVMFFGRLKKFNLESHKVWRMQ